MEFTTPQAYTPVDSRIFLSSYVNDLGVKETYPLNSFLLEHLLCDETTPSAVYTSDTNTPNTFFSAAATRAYLPRIAALAQPMGALSVKSMYYYEYAWWAAPPQLSGQGNVVYTSTLQLYNPLSNTRWVIAASKLPQTQPSLSQPYPAITWSEREVQDMLGVRFSKLKDSRRLLLDYKIHKGVLLQSKSNQKQCVPKFSNYSDIYYA